MPTRKKYTIPEVIRNCAAAIQYIRIYTINHQLSKNKIREFAEYLNGYFTHNKTSQFTIGIVNGEFVSGQEVFIELSRMLSGIIKLLIQRKIEKLVIKSAVSYQELESFIALLLDTESPDTGKPFQELLTNKGIANISTGMLALETDASDAGEPRNKIATHQYYQMLITSISGFIDKLFNNYASDQDCGMFINLVDQLGKNMEEDFESLFRIFGYLKTRNNYEYIHSAHVAILTLAQARSLQFDKALISKVGIAGFLHDVGKLSMPLEILNKESALSKEEFELMKQHPVRGAEFLSKYTGTFGELPIIVCFQHHIKHDLSGYPENLLFAKEPHLVSKMTTISDVYDALRSNRAYRYGLAPEKVYEIMIKDKGTAFDPFLLDNFFRIIGIWSPGTIVELSNGLIGIVRSENPDYIDKPQIDIFFDGNAMKKTESSVDMEKEQTLEIKRSLTPDDLEKSQIPIPENYVI